MVVKQYENEGSVLEDFQLYDLHARQKKTDAIVTEYGAESLAQPKIASESGYKVKDLIHSTQAEDKKMLEIDGDTPTLFRDSESLNEEYGDRWLTEQTNDDGRHSTQVKNTLRSYEKFADWVRRDSNGRETSVLDASSGLGLGTEHLRQSGMNVDDVEPYPSADRTEPTYRSYDDIDKQYDYIISNAVLNVIPDDWRANVLHSMADKLKVGGKMLINVRSAEEVAKQGVEGKTKITLDSPSEILVLRPDGSIRAYQRGFTKAELKEWCEKELGEGYTVEIATERNAGGTYGTAVVVTKITKALQEAEPPSLAIPPQKAVRPWLMSMQRYNKIPNEPNVWVNFLRISLKTGHLEVTSCCMKLQWQWTRHSRQKSPARNPPTNRSISIWATA